MVTGVEIESQNDPNLAFAAYNDTDKFRIFNLRLNLFVEGSFSKTECLQFINKYKDMDVMDYVVVHDDYPSFVCPVFIGMRWKPHEHPLKLE